MAAKKINGHPAPLAQRLMLGLDDQFLMTRLDIDAVRRSLDAQLEVEPRLPVGVWIFPGALLGLCLFVWLAARIAGLH